MNEEPANISERLASLESDYNALSERVYRIRMDDFKRAVVSDIADVLFDEGEKLAHRGAETMQGFAICRNRKACRDALEDVMHLAADAFYRTGPDSALTLLHEFRENITQEFGCESRECQEYVTKVLNEAIVSMNIASRLQERMESLGAITHNPRSGSLRVDIVETLSALANPHRLRILEALYESEKSFSDLSKVTGLRTGHLQFHLQALQEQGTIRKTPIRGVYAITIPGMTALEGLCEFDTRMGSLLGVKGV